MAYGVIQVDNSGWDGTALVSLDPVPHYAGLQYPRQIVTPVYTHDDGIPVASLRDKVLTPAQYSARLSAFGLGSAKSAKITISLPGDDRSAMGTYNGVVVRPDHGTDSPWDVPLYRNVTWLVRRLKATS